MGMTFFQNKRKDMAILLSCILGILVAWFGIPASLSTWNTYDTYRSRSVVPVSLPDEERKIHENAITGIKAALRDSDKQGNANYGQQYESLGQHYEALGLLGKSASAYGSAWSEGLKTNELLLSLARVQQQMRYYAQAEGYYRQAIERDPTRIDTYQKLANLYFYDMNDLDRARGVYIEGLGKTDNNVDLMKLFANHLELAGNRHEAYLYWDAVLKKDLQNKTVEAHLKTFDDIKGNFGNAN